MDTFDGQDMGEYSKRIQSLLTSKYRSEFDKQFEPLKKVFAQTQATGSGKILVTGLGSADKDSATVLVVHDALAASKLGNQERHHRWSVELVKVEGKWLVDDFKPII